MCTKLEVCSFTHSWDNRGYWKNFGSPWIRPCSLFSPIFKGLLFARTLWIHLPNLKFIALHVPDIIGDTQKIWAVPGCAHAPFSSKFFTGLCSDGPCECIGQICNLWFPIFSSIFTRFRDIANFVLQHATFPTAPLVSPKFPHVPLGVGGWLLGYKEQRCWANCLCN